MFLKTLNANGKLVPTSDYLISSTSKITGETLSEENITIKLIDFPKLFDLLFNLPCFLSGVIEYIKKLKLQTDLIYNVIQTEFWQTKMETLSLDENTLALPIVIYFDDLKPLNALGSHSGIYKIGGVYISIACLPPQIQSKLKSIYLAMFFFTDDRRKFGNTRIFQPFIDILNKLQREGIDVQHNQIKKVKLIPIAILGDNLGLNSILGFVESFSSNFYCRFCKSPKSENQKNIEENKMVLRNINSYDIDVQTKNVTLTGIQENSVWNNLDNFHVVDNFGVDIMHDLLEGVCHYDLLNIIEKMIGFNFFSLEKLNDRIYKHDYGPTATNINRVLITRSMFKQKKMKLSASEMLTFLNHFPLMIGDLIDVNCLEWKLYLILNEIVAIVFEKTAHPLKYQQLESLVAEHHQIYVHCFGDTLKPKHHFMLHYPRIMKNVGSLSQFTSMRFESNHKIWKDVAKNITCRKKPVTIVFGQIPTSIC